MPDKILKNYCHQCHINKISISGYYCCNKDEMVCFQCRDKLCKSCNGSRNNKSHLQSCKICLKKQNNFNELFRQFQCDEIYCSSCLAKLFRKIYLQNTKEKRKENIQLFCGHYCSFTKLQTYFKQFCFNCGDKYKQNYDYCLLDNCKVCSKCLKYIPKFVYQQLIRCMNCQIILKTKSQAGTIQNDGFIICKQCTQQSQNEQRKIQIEENKQNYKIKSQKKQKSQQRYNINQKKIEFEDRKQQLKQLQQSQKQQKPKQNQHKSKKILCKFSIEQLQSSQINRQGPKMKKMFSMQTEVQNYKITIEIIPIDEVMCSQCNAIVPKNSAMKKKYGSTLQIEAKQAKNTLRNNLCRACYSHEYNRQDLGFSKDLSDVFQGRDRHNSSYKMKRNNSPLLKNQTKFDFDNNSDKKLDRHLKIPSSYQFSKNQSEHFKFKDKKCVYCKNNNRSTKTTSIGELCSFCYCLSKF